MWRKTLLVLVSLTAACSGRVSEPSGLSDPVGPVTFKLRNTTQADVYVRWQQTAPIYDINQAGKHLDTLHWCTPLCEESCACVDCAPMPDEVLKLAAGETYSFTWTGTWYEPRSCSGGCSCDETRATLAGSYQITVAGARAFKASGAATPGPGTKPGVTTNAEPDLSKGACQSQRTVSLVVGAQTVDLDISCDK
ncbi:MAG: hypothetical protein HY898_11225 [Deltaproteobacteria bacterium]|nr:hypothetical protein [Deltaproteobacteria bacterium]